MVLGFVLFYFGLFCVENEKMSGGGEAVGSERVTLYGKQDSLLKAGAETSSLAFLISCRLG